MSDEQPLVDDEELGDFGRALLKAGREASPLRSARDKLLMGIGLGVVTTAAHQAVAAQKLASLKLAAVGAGGALEAAAAAARTREDAGGEIDHGDDQDARADQLQHRCSQIVVLIGVVIVGKPFILPLCRRRCKS